MSSLIVEVRRFELKAHPNADSLSLAYPEGTTWQCCCRTDGFKGETLALYIPIDTMIPAALAAEWGLPHAKEDKDFRLKTIKLRGEVSQGLLIPNKGRFAEGEDVADILGLTKYEAPERGSQGPQNYIAQPDGFDKYTDIENIKNYPNALLDGECVVVTEKLHGSNARMGWVGTGVFNPAGMVPGVSLVEDEGGIFRPDTGEMHNFHVGSRRMVIDPESEGDQWVNVAKKYDIAAKLWEYPGYVVYGELIGANVQKLAYDFKEKEFRAFDVWDGTRYLDTDDFFGFCARLAIPTVPILYAGPYSKDVLDLRNGKSTIASHIREGIVIKPVTERWERGVGRVVMKSVSEAYLLGNWDE
jgi:RNA ligase (TIGR02306 family)